MKEKFNRCFKSKGGLYINSSEQIESYLNFINQTISSICKKWENTPDVYINLISNTLLNAHARKFEQNYFIGINAGTVFLIEETFLKIISNKHLTEENYSKINIEVNNGINYNPYFSTEILGIAIEDDYQKAINHIKIVLQFLIYHELCHIYRGHVDYIQKELSLDSISEIDDSPDYVFNINLKQTLEMDADSLSTKSFYETSEYLLQNDPLFSQEDYLYEYVYSIYCFFRIFGFYSLKISEIKSSTHPPASIRISFILDHIATIMLELNKSEYERNKIIDKILQAIKDAENDVCNITFFENQLDSFKEIYRDDKIKKYKSNILKNWQTLKPDLEKYTFIKLSN